MLKQDVSVAKQEGAISVSGAPRRPAKASYKVYAPCVHKLEAKAARDTKQMAGANVMDRSGVSGARTAAEPARVFRHSVLDRLHAAPDRRGSVDQVHSASHAGQRGINRTPAFRPVPLREILTLMQFDEYASRPDKGLKGSTCPRAKEGAMLRNRLLILLGGCFLTASAAWADDVGYVDCTNHPEETQVFAKARKTPDVVASLPCGERFTIVLYGFIFSRIQTRDGRVGYVYSNLISGDRRSGASVQQQASAQVPAAPSNLPSTAATVAQPTPPAPTQGQPTPAQPSTTPAPGPASSIPETTSAVAQPTPPRRIQPQPVPVRGVTIQAAPTEAASTQAPGPVSNASISSTPETTATAVQPDPAAPTQPQPAPAEAAAPAIRAAETRTTWERPNPGGLRRAPLIELFGGYAFARFVSGGTATNFNGGLGSVGWNVKPWLQIVGDSSYSVVTISGVKNVLYGNHYGPRLFRRGRNRWGATPFVEALVGGSRADTTVSGAGGYTTSANSISYKAGGGLDIHPYRHVEIRLFDIDYYRTSFGTNVHQNNYWASTGAWTQDRRLAY